MNNFSVTFKNALGQIKTEEMMALDFITIKGVIAWFEDAMDIRIISISKHLKKNTIKIS